MRFKKIFMVFLFVFTGFSPFANAKKVSEKISILSRNSEIIGRGFERAAKLSGKTLNFDKLNVFMSAKLYCRFINVFPSVCPVTDFIEKKFLFAGLLFDKKSLSYKIDVPRSKFPKEFMAKIPTNMFNPNPLHHAEYLRVLLGRPKNPSQPAWTYVSEKWISFDIEYLPNSARRNFQGKINIYLDDLPIDKIEPVGVKLPGGRRPDPKRPPWESLIRFI